MPAARLSVLSVWSTYASKSVEVSVVLRLRAVGLRQCWSLSESGLHSAAAFLWTCQWDPRTFFTLTSSDGRSEQSLNMLKLARVALR